MFTSCNEMFLGEKWTAITDFGVLAQIRSFFDDYINS